ncbi:MAG: hypothetical protein AAFX08_07680 [Pseudomonadota bacterium]
MTEDEQKRRKQRNLAIAGGIAAFIVLVYLVTLMRIGASVSGGG